MIYRLICEVSMINCFILNDAIMTSYGRHSDVGRSSEASEIVDILTLDFDENSTLLYVIFTSFCFGALETANYFWNIQRITHLEKF